MATEKWKRLKNADRLLSIVETVHRIEDAIYNDRAANIDESKRLMIDAKSVIDKLLESK